MLPRSARSARRSKPACEEIVGAECREQSRPLADAGVFSLDIPFNTTAISRLFPKSADECVLSSPLGVPVVCLMLGRLPVCRLTALNILPSTSPAPVSGWRWYLVAKALHFADRAVTLSDLRILPCYTSLVCYFLMNRSRDIQPSHDGEQCGSLQS